MTTYFDIYVALDSGKSEDDIVIDLVAEGMPEWEAREQIIWTRMLYVMCKLDLA